MRPALPLAALLALSLTACGKGDFFAQQTSTGVPPLVGYSLLHAYGDSITQGVGVANQSFVYVALSAAYNSLPLSDRARSGDESCDIASGQIFPNAELPSLATHGLYSVLIGTTDVDNRGAGAGETIFNTCHQAVLAWLATPVEFKVLAFNPTVTTTGNTHQETGFRFNNLATDSIGSTITFPFTRTATAPLYLWYRIFDGNSGTFTCALDGTTIAALTTATPVPVQTLNGLTGSMAVLRTPGVAPGSHTLVCTQTAGTQTGMSLIAIGGPPPAGTQNLPRLLAGLLPLQLSGGHSTILAAYNADIRGNVALFAGDGLDLELFDAAQYMTGTPTDMSDALHPNATGQQEIYRAFEQTLN